MVILLPGLVLLAFVSSQTGFSLHSRYALPALPFFFLWTSKVGRAFRNVRRRDPNESGKRLERPQGYRTVRVLTIVLTAWSTLSVLSVYPNSISYFNELAAVIPTSGTERPTIPRVQKSHRLSSWYKTLVSAGPINGPRHLLDRRRRMRQRLRLGSRRRAAPLRDPRRAASRRVRRPRAGRRARDARKRTRVSPVRRRRRLAEPERITLSKSPPALAARDMSTGRIR